MSNQRYVGTVARGIRLPIIKPGDDLVETCVQGVVQASKAHNFDISDGDIIGITESILARAQRNIVSVDEISEDIDRLYGFTEFDTDSSLAVIFPIFSRNRFSILLRGIALSHVKKIYIVMSFPRDEVGNSLVDINKFERYGISTASTISEDEFKEKFGKDKHEFTGINYVQLYEEIVRNAGCEVEFVFSNDPRKILEYDVKNVLVCSIHDRKKIKSALKDGFDGKVYGLDDVMNAPIRSGGYNQDYGLLGSNKVSEDEVKLFPRDCKEVVDQIQEKMKECTDKHVEVLVYGDGAFKDPVGQIWELADPVVSPGYTSGLLGRPNELKLKYIADNDLKDKDGQELIDDMKEMIRNKKENGVGDMSTQGTTPRQYTDLIGSLCDLISGSGDKGTPVVLIQGYFDNFSTD